MIMLSQQTDDEAILRALRLGASEYLAKPFSAPELLARLEKVLRQGQIHRWAKSLQRNDITMRHAPAAGVPAEEDLPGLSLRLHGRKQHVGDREQRAQAQNQKT